MSFNFVLKNLIETEKYFNFKGVFNELLEILDNYHKYPGFLEHLVKDGENFEEKAIEHLIGKVIDDGDQNNKYKRILQKIKE